MTQEDDILSHLPPEERARVRKQIGTFEASVTAPGQAGLCSAFHTKAIAKMTQRPAARIAIQVFHPGNEMVNIETADPTGLGEALDIVRHAFSAATVTGRAASSASSPLLVTPEEIREAQEAEEQLRREADHKAFGDPSAN